MEVIGDVLKANGRVEHVIVASDRSGSLPDPILVV